MKTQKIQFSKRVSINALFYFFLFAGIFFKGIGLSNSSKVYMLILLIGGTATILKIITNKFTRGQLIVVLMLGLSAVGSLIVTQKPTFALTCLCIAGMQNVDLDFTFEMIYKIKLGTFILMLILVFTGLRDGGTVNMWRDGTGMVTRYALGYGHPNLFHLTLFIIIALFIHVRRGRLKIYQYIICAFVNVFFYHYTGSRTGAYLIFLLLLLNIINGGLSKKRWGNFIYILPFATLIISVMLSIGPALLYGTSVFIDKLNLMFNNRIAYGSYYLKNYGLTLFGNRGILADENALLDNSYILIELQYGLAALLILGMILISACIVIKQSRRFEDVGIAVTLMIYMIFESFGVNIFINILFLYAAPLIFNTVLYKKRIGINER